MLYDEMTYILSPIILVITSLIVLLVEFVTKKKSVLLTTTIFGLILSTLILFIQYLTFDQPRSIFFGTLIFDKFYLFSAIVLSIITSSILIGFYDYLIKQISFVSEFISLILLSLIGSLFVIMAVDFITIYLSLELSSLPIIALIAFGRGKFSLEASFKYLILASFSTGIFLTGVAYIYGVTGSLSLEIINISAINPAITLGLIFIFIGLAFKLSIAPWHMWTPDTYQGSPMPVVTYLSTASKVAGFVLAIRLFSQIFSDSFTYSNLIILLSLVSLASMTIGNLGAILQKDLKRLFAYSTVAHAGYMIIGIIALISSNSSASTTMFYVVGYAITNLSVFFSLQHMMNLTKSTSIDSLKGLFQSHPYVSVIFGLGILSLLGIPATVGFMGKVLVFSSAVNNGLVLLAIAGVINSFVSAYYYLGLLRNVFVSSDKFEQNGNSNNSYILVASISSVLVLVLGIYPDLILSTIDNVISGL